MIEEQLIAQVSQLGFPIVVAMYSLIRLESTVRENTKVLQAIATKIDIERK